MTLLTLAGRPAAASPSTPPLAVEEVPTAVEADEPVTGRVGGRDRQAGQAAYEVRVRDGLWGEGEVPTFSAWLPA
ncbi:MAG: hypothetical protein ACPF9W_00085 [Nocardioides sp.]